MINKKKNSKVGRPVNKNSDETRQAILNAAMICFSTDGYEATSNKSIAQIAGVTAGSIYHYFENKSSLFAEVYREIEQKMLDILGDKLSNPKSLTSGWEEINEAIFDFHIKEPDLSKFNAMVKVEMQRNPELTEIIDGKELQQTYQKLVNLAKENGQVDEGKEEQLRAVLVAVSLGINQHAIEASETDHKYCLDGFVGLFNGTLIKQS